MARSSYAAANPDTIYPVEAAAMLKRELVRRFPPTSFSVRRGTGTAASWLYVAWTDGPAYETVVAITDRYEGVWFDGMDDSHHPTGTCIDGRRLAIAGVSISHRLSSDS